MKIKYRQLCLSAEYIPQVMLAELYIKLGDRDEAASFLVCLPRLCL
jgi:hypothetical protein